MDRPVHPPPGHPPPGHSTGHGTGHTAGRGGARGGGQEPRHVPDGPGPLDLRDVPDMLDQLDGPALCEQLRADTALITAAAAALRHDATQDAYRGLRRPDHAYSIASVLDLARIRWRDQDPAVRARLRTCCAILLDTTPPAGPDPDP